MKNFDSLIEALADLKDRGYEEDFETMKVCLYCGDLDIRMNPEEFHIDEVYCIEGDSSSPDDNSVIYAITASNGVKGTLVDAYGIYVEDLNFKMTQKLRAAPAVVFNLNSPV